MKDNEKKTKRGRNTAIFAVIAVILIAVIVLVASKSGMPLFENVNILSGNQTIELPYDFSLRMPGKYADIIEHTRETYGDRITDAFVLDNGGDGISLYRIDFGDRESGDWLGLLNIDERLIPVTYTMFSADPDEIAKLDERGQEAYEAMRDAFNSVMIAITSDPRFVEEEQTVINTEQMVEMKYWEVSLLEGVTFEETVEEGSYLADFYGEMQGEKIKLYSVQIGDQSLQTVLGLFEIDGVKKSVSVESYSLSDQNDWSQSEYETVYCMMDTINNVIDQIICSEFFSES